MELLVLRLGDLQRVQTEEEGVAQLQQHNSAAELNPTLTHVSHDVLARQRAVGNEHELRLAGQIQTLDVQVEVPDIIIL